MNDELGRICKEVVVAYTGVCLEELKKNVANVTVEVRNRTSSIQV
jgi:hypothetical protein